MFSYYFIRITLPGLVASRGSRDELFLNCRILTFAKFHKKAPQKIVDNGGGGGPVLKNYNRKLKIPKWGTNLNWPQLFGPAPSGADSLRDRRSPPSCVDFHTHFLLGSRFRGAVGRMQIRTTPWGRKIGPKPSVVAQNSPPGAKIARPVVVAFARFVVGTARWNPRSGSPRP